MDKINLQEKFALFTEHWQPKLVGQLNDYEIRIAKIQGDFIWHSHADTAEFFMVIKGRMQMSLREKTVDLEAGDIFVVPQGIEHKPFAESECHIMMLELAGTSNTGSIENNRTVTKLERI